MMLISNFMKSLLQLITVIISKYTAGKDLPLAAQIVASGMEEDTEAQ